MVKEALLQSFFWLVYIILFGLIVFKTYLYVKG
jgi:hypothetical protein